MNPQQPQQQPEQPVPASQPQPITPVAPPQLAAAPAPDTNSFQEQPKVQYVVMQKSLEGLGGWLAFFLVAFSISSLVYIGSTFSPVGVHTFTSPLLALGYITSVVLIALRKRNALWVIYGTLLISLIANAVNLVVNAGENIGETVGPILTATIFHGLVALYFFVSKRVKATLTK